ncbi:uncharacterized protein LOC114945240 isoform X2 [Nylanderia fulva]|uniref:uncharacterized protein LOC114945240 isoform X2 n=1 Tax=Nylanderia fulva TaxID=613905 RepID=UPI0010FADFC5|nr:uncharacterized protein LOC114945240 isoform X2 [Nylanderia fulva]
MNINKYENEIRSPNDVFNSPDKADNLQNLNDTDYKDENMNNSQNGKNIFLLENIFENPIFKEQENDLQSAKAIQINSQRRQTISTSSDYNIFKSELNNMDNFNEFEETDDSLTNKDPVTDPLFISDCEEKNVDTSLVNSKSQSIKQEKSKYLHDKQISNVNNPFKKSTCKLNKKEKHLLKELKNVEEEEELPLPFINKLCSLCIKLIHKVPPQHKIENTGSHAPTRQEKKLFERYGPLRKGLYTPAEDKVITKNWETFCQLHDWNTKMVTPFLKWRHNEKYYISSVKERQKFVQFLANGLPWRTLHSVYARFKVIYCKKITYARYTLEEDNKILMYIRNEEFNKRNTKYIELAKLLKRTRRSIIKRYQYLKKIETDSEKEPSNIIWTLSLIKKFIKTLLNVTLSEDIRELKNAIIPKSVWQKMEEQLNIDENILKSFWQHQLHLQLFSPNPVYLNDIKIQLIEYIYEKGISNTREIVWPNVAKHLDGTTAVFLCKTFFYLVQECNINDMENFADIVEYLYHIKIPEIKEALTDKFLPRIVHKKGKIYLLNAEDSNDTLTTNSDN